MRLPSQTVEKKIRKGSIAECLGEGQCLGNTSIYEEGWEGDPEGRDKERREARETWRI